MDYKDYYQVLGLDRSASQDQIKQAYRKLAFQFHPDRNTGDAGATEKMKQINEAYATLSAPAKRREYDFLRDQYGDQASERFRQAHATEDIFRGSDIADIFEEFARSFGFRGSEEVFREFYGQGTRSFEFRGPGQFGRAYVFYGSARPVENSGQTSQTQVPLPEFPFPGTFGRVIKFFLERVTGVRFPVRGKDLKDSITLSQDIAGKGGEIEYEYHWDRSRKLMVKVPAGTKDGQRIRLRGMGAPGKHSGQPGDLYLRVRVRRRFLQKLKGLFLPAG